MTKQDLRILILEDDATLGKAIDEALKRAGYSTQIATNYTQAKSNAKFGEFHGIVADCMLPQKSGVDVTLEIMEQSQQDLVVVLTSGIFKDKSYAHDAQLRTKARAFLHKPFDILELVKHFDDAFASLLDNTGNPLYQALSQIQISTRERVAVVQKCEFIHGFDLPYIFTLLIDPQISGDLELQYEDRPKAVISFNRGQVDKVQYPDTESYFGVLLLERGFTTPEELQEGLDQEGDKPIGAKLVENSSLSPHAVEVIQHEQMVIRISKTIRDSTLKIAFVEQTKDEPKVALDGVLLANLLSDWICSKITHDWLTSFYTPWLENPLVKGPEWSKIDRIKNLPAAATFCLRLDTEWPQNVHDLILNPAQEEDLLRGLHFLLLQRMLVFGSRLESNERFDMKISRLEKIWENFQTQNYFEILGVHPKARSSEISRAYHDLAKNLHPDKLSPQAPPDLKQLAQTVFAQITEAYQHLSSDAKRKQYQKTLELGFAEEILKSESVFEEGLRLLKVSHFREARKCFEAVLRLKGHRSDAIVYFIWALIKEKRNKTDHHELVERIRPYMSQVAHEDRHSANYFFIKGMFFELEGNVEKAYKHLKHANTLSPYFIDVKREMTYIKKYYSRRKKQTFTDEFTGAVTKLFKRRNG